MKRLSLLLLTTICISTMFFSNVYATTFSNFTNKPVWVVWTADGCGSVGQIFGFWSPSLCDGKEVNAGKTIQIDYPLLTSNHKLNVLGSKNDSWTYMSYWKELNVSGNVTVALQPGWGPKSDHDSNFKGCEKKVVNDKPTLLCYNHG